MTKLPIAEGVLDYLNEKNSPFSMPGHKNARGFLRTEKGRKLYENLIKADITEVEGLDNLHKPEGIIKEAQDLLSKLYGSIKSYFLINGSTSGNLAMIFSVFEEGDKIITERNCHRSVYNAIIMRKLNPIYVKNAISEKYNAPLYIDEEHFLKQINDNPDAKGIVITYPNYYGVCFPLGKIIAKAKQNGMKVLIDSAHGAHFGICEELPQSALKLGADIVVMSAHKTLPSLTQTAYMHVNKGVNIKKTDFYVSAFSSTSPSYIFLSVLDYARYYLEENGKSDYEALVKSARKYRQKINEIKGFHVIERDDIIEEQPGIDIDESRFVIFAGREYSGHKLLEYLRANKIQCEMSDNNSVVLILSPFNEEEDFDRLITALKNALLEQFKESSIQIEINEIPQKVMFPFEAFEKNDEEISVYEASGRTCAESIVPYPPGIPLVMPGEKVDEYSLNMIQYYLKNKVTLLGMKDNKIRVIEK